MTAFYIGRQPILDAEGSTYGYEILFRSTEENYYDASVDGDTATARVLVDTIVEAGLSSIVGSSKAFFNLTQRFLEHPEMLELIEPGTCVLEVLEDVQVTDEVVAGVSALRAMGHIIALDDFVDEEQFARLLPLAQIIKYDITQHSKDDLIAHRLKDAEAGRLSLAERVETLEEYNELKAAGFQYFQGYYFAKPKVVSGVKLPQNKVAILQLLAQISDPNISIEVLAETLSHDIALSVRTLRYVNSPMCGLKSEVTSIRHAALMLGREPIRNWVTLLVLTGMDDKPPELMKMALARARFCQLLAQYRSLDNDAMYFTIGLLSLLGVLIDSELDVALKQVSISKEISDQLLLGKGVGGEMLALIAQLESTELGADAVPDIEINGPLYQKAIAWTEVMFEII